MSQGNVHGMDFDSSTNTSAINELVGKKGGAKRKANTTPDDGTVQVVLGDTVRDTVEMFARAYPKNTFLLNDSCVSGIMSRKFFNTGPKKYKATISLMADSANKVIEGFGIYGGAHHTVTIDNIVSHQGWSPYRVRFAETVAAFTKEYKNLDSYFTEYGTLGVLYVCTGDQILTECGTAVDAQMHLGWFISLGADSEVEFCLTTLNYGVMKHSGYVSKVNRKK